VGKTSLGMSICEGDPAASLCALSPGAGFVIEAEVRGHRRTYIGALPGQILQMMKEGGDQ